MVQSGGILSIKIVFHLHNFIDQTCLSIDTLFKFRCNEICNKNKIAYSTVSYINLIDTIVNNYITVQEQWKIFEITITCVYTVMHIATVIVLHTSTEKHVTSGSFRSGNQIINAVCFVVLLVLTNFSKKIFQSCYV